MTQRTLHPRAPRPAQYKPQAFGRGKGERTDAGGLWRHVSSMSPGPDQTPGTAYSASNFSRLPVSHVEDETQCITGVFRK